MQEFDIDKCYLTKDQILHDVGDVLIERWEVGKKSNWWIIAIAKAIQRVIQIMPSEHVEAYYREASKLVFYIMLKNERARDPTLQKLPEPEPPKPVYVVSEQKRKPLKMPDFMAVFKEGGMKDNC